MKLHTLTYSVFVSDCMRQDQKHNQDHAGDAVKSIPPELAPSAIFGQGFNLCASPFNAS